MWVFLNNLIKKFRGMLNDDNLSLSELHIILDTCGIKPNKQNKYNKNILNLLLQGYIVHNYYDKEISFKDIRAAYNQIKHSKYKPEYEFLKQQPLEKFPSVPPQYNNKKEDGELYWKDGGEDMEKANQYLLNKYQNESIDHKKIILTNEQYQILTEMTAEGVEYTKNDDNTINISVNSNKDDKSNSEVDTRVFGKKNEILYGDGTLNGHYKTFSQLYSDRGKMYAFYKNALKWVMNGMNGDMPSNGSDLANRKISEFIRVNDIDGLKEWLNKMVESYSQDYEMLSGKYNRLKKYNDNDTVLRYNTGKINGTNVDVIALFTFNDFNFSDAIKHGNLRQNPLTDKLLGKNKEDRNLTPKVGRQGKLSADRIQATYDNQSVGNIKGNFSLDNVTDGHYKTQYGYNGEGGYNSVRQFIDKSILYANYALKEENFHPDYIVCAPSSSDFNNYYCKTLSRKIGVPFIKDFFKRNLLNITFPNNVQNQMKQDGLTEKDIMKINTVIQKIVYREVASYVSKPLDMFFDKYYTILSNISTTKNSREKTNINIIKDVFYKWVYNSLINTKQSFSQKGGNIYKAVVKNMLNTTSNIQSNSVDISHIEHEIVSRIKLKIGIKVVESIIEQVDNLLVKYANKLNQGMNFDLRMTRFKITDLDKRYRKYLSNVYIITDKVMNSDGNLFNRYLNAKFLIFDEDMNSGVTLRLTIDALLMKLPENNDRNIKCLVNAYSNKGK